MTEDEMVRWHHRLNGHEFEQVPRVGDGQGSIAEKAMATHCNIIAWEIPWTEKLAGTGPGVAKVGPDLATKPPYNIQYLKFN